MTTNSSDSDEQIEVDREKWNKQEIADARNILRTQLKNEPRQQSNNPKAGKFKIILFLF